MTGTPRELETTQRQNLLLTGLTVLVVEDSAVQRGHAVSLLQALGASVVLEAADGVEGLEQLAIHTSIDLVLTDLDMPRLDGVGFIGEAAVRGHFPEVIVLSAQDRSVIHAVRLMAESWGFSVPGVLPKPVTLEALARVLGKRVLAARDRTSARRERPECATITTGEIDDGIRAGEFLCHFQPQVTLRGALLKGVEALVRWRKPGVGILAPNAFLPQAEEDADLMDRLTMAVLDFVAAQWHGWRRHGLMLEVSVNISARSISRQGFADRLMEAAERLELPPKFLVFELTESASVSNLGHTLANLARLRMRGYRLSIDDFGTGFATFEQLERIPFSELKLDRSIVKNLPHSDRHRVVARSLMQLTRGLQLSTVAEGIETLETWNALRTMGCDRGQGYLIARPMPGEDLLAWSQEDRDRLKG